MRANHRVHKAIEAKKPAVLNNAGSLPPSAEGGLVLQDNRPTSVLQQKRLNALKAVQAHQPPIQKKANNTGLPDNLKSGVENSVIARNDVNVHNNSVQPAQLNAHVYAQGTDIDIAPGQEKHLPHEAWHVVQQKQGRVKPTLQMKAGIPVNDDKSLEHEADMMGRKVLQLKARYNNLPRASFVRARTVQRIGEEGATEHEQSGRFIINDNQPVSGKQVHKMDFLNALSASISGVADEVLAKVHQTSASCPYIAYWFSPYENQTPAYIERALARYAPGALTAGSWQDCVHAVSTRVKTAFQNHVATGTLNGVPEGVPKDLIEEIKPPEKPETVQLMADVAQLCGGCCEDTTAPTGSSAPEAKAGAVMGIAPLVATGVVPGGGGRLDRKEVEIQLADVQLDRNREEKRTAQQDRDVKSLTTGAGGTAEIKAEDAPGRVRKPREDGMLYTEHQRAAMHAFIIRAKNLIKEGQYQQAYELLTNEDEARNVGVTRLLINKAGRNPVARAKENKARPDQQQVSLFVPAIPDWFGDAGVARTALLMHLEEYMHMYQAGANSFLSQKTSAFKHTGQLADQASAVGISAVDDAANYDEIDILAQWFDWGFDVKNDAFLGYYDERGTFLEWLLENDAKPTG